MNNKALKQLTCHGQKKSNPFRTDKEIESLDLPNKEVKPYIPSIESPPVLELKSLPSHLKYVYLGDCWLIL